MLVPLIRKISGSQRAPTNPSFVKAITKQESEQPQTRLHRVMLSRKKRKKKGGEEPDPEGRSLTEGEESD